jgi:hypothetical protein
VRLRHTVEDPKRPGRTRVKYTLSSRSRHMNQVFLRGEQVVTVAVDKDGDDFDDDEEEERTRRRKRRTRTRRKRRKRRNRGEGR